MTLGASRSELIIMMINSLRGGILSSASLQPLAPELQDVFCVCFHTSYASVTQLDVHMLRDHLYLVFSCPCYKHDRGIHAMLNYVAMFGFVFH